MRTGGLPRRGAIPVAVADPSNPYPVAGGPVRAASDTYEIGLVQYRHVYSSSMPQGALARGYVQLETPSFVAANPGVSQHVELFNELKDGTTGPDTGGSA